MDLTFFGHVVLFVTGVVNVVVTIANLFMTRRINVTLTTNGNGKH